MDRNNGPVNRLVLHATFIHAYFPVDTRIATNSSPIDFQRSMYFSLLKEFPTCQECETAACYLAAKVKATKLPQFISFDPRCQGNEALKNASATNIDLTGCPKSFATSHFHVFCLHS